MSKEVTARSAMKLALEALNAATRYGAGGFEDAKDALRAALASEAKEQPAQQQEPVGPEPFGYFQYDIRLDAWVQNRINNKGVAFYIKEKP